MTENYLVSCTSRCLFRAR